MCVSFESSLPEAPNGWEKLDMSPPPDHLITLQIGLKQHNFEGLVEELYRVSDPEHSSEAEEFVKPHPNTLSAVNDWFCKHSVNLSSVSRSPAGDWATFTIPISRAEAMLNSKYHIFRHRDLGHHAVRTLGYSVPRDLDIHIDTIQPTTMIRRKISPGLQLSRRSALSRTSRPSANINASCSDLITPDCLRTLYKTDNYTVSAQSKNKLGIASYAGDYASNSDLQAFFAKYRPSAKGSNFTVLLVNGGQYNESDTGGGEATLDVQANDEQSVPRDYAQRVCNSFAQLGARGVSLLFGSGDGGVGSGECTTNDGTNKTMFIPTFPATCVNPEVAADSASNANFVTGGGFSNDGDDTEADSGTSASTPAAAAVISLLNDYLISKGKPPLGFLNPFLYSKGHSGFKDITSGGNEGCGTDGFKALEGWDPVTGFGTPNFVELQKLVI
ncbi:hypothetical protein HWV62_33141 [Athelia sp. TMB]|nr:hypothetical protein HWV62_33141 [Athelia sp. TMB]